MQSYMEENKYAIIKSSKPLQYIRKITYILQEYIHVDPGIYVALLPALRAHHPKAFDSRAEKISNIYSAR